MTEVRSPTPAHLGDGTTLLLIGAGASHGARRGLTGFAAAPPVGQDLAQYVLDWIDSWSPCTALFHDYTDATTPSLDLFGQPITWIREFFDQAARKEIGIEKALRDLLADATLRGAGGARLLELNRILAEAMLIYKRGPFEAGADRYDALLSAVGFPAQGVTCITPNYDILFEEAVARAPGARCMGP